MSGRLTFQLLSLFFYLGPSRRCRAEGEKWSRYYLSDVGPGSFFNTRDMQVHQWPFVT